MKLVLRSEWGARNPKRRDAATFTRLSTGHWNGPTITVYGQLTWDHHICASLVRGIQNFHMDDRGWNDIAYNFLVCPHEYVFEGRGMHIINAANGTNEANRSSHAIMFLAGELNQFSHHEKTGFKQCVRYISERSQILEKAVGHRDHKATSCPGEERYSWIHRDMPTHPSFIGSDQPLLKYGMRGDAVRLVQLIIRDKAGGNIAVDGIFGPNTERRVKDLQKFFGLTPDGIVGPKTWAVLSFLASR
jgi:hypothetical protein